MYNFTTHSGFIKAVLAIGIVCICFWPKEITAQCSTPVTPCVDAIPIACSDFSGTLEDVPAMGGIFPGCDGWSLDNPIWFTFVMPVDGDMLVDILPSDCQGSGSGGGLGFQAGIYRDCDPNSESLALQCPCTTGGIVFSVPNVTAGVYYLVVDGCAADVCDFEINITPDQANLPVGIPDQPMASDTTPCPGTIVEFSVPPVPNAESYNWSFPPGVTPVGAPTCNTVSVIWGSSGGCVEVVVENKCSAPQSSPELCIEVPHPEGFDYGYYCFPSEPGWYHPGTQTFYPTNIDIPWITNEGCDSTIHLIIVNNVVEDSLTEIICTGGQSSEIGGLIFSEAIDTQFIFPGAGIDGCDSVLYVSILEDENKEIADIIVDHSDCDSISGSAYVVLAADTTGAIYSWSNGGSGPMQSDLAIGEYSVTVDNGLTGCRSHQNFEIDLDSSCYVIISGSVFDDKINKDCVVDPTSYALPNIMVSLGNGEFDFTDSQGNFEFSVLPGTYELSIEWDTARYSSLCTQPIVVDAFTPGTTYGGNEFFLEIIAEVDMGLKVSKLNPRPGFSRSVRICVMNYGDSPMSGTLTFRFDDLQLYDDANIAPDSFDQSNQTLVWNFANHLPGVIVVYRVFLFTPANIPIGTDLDFYFLLETDFPDSDLSNNEITRSCQVVNGYDPNDKQVLPVGEGPLGGIRPDLADTMLSYHIRFQNTGTDTAYTVVVRDTLDSDLDIRNVVPGPGSHPYDLEVLDGKVLEFRFENIYLPDSTTNEPLSHGFVFFDVALDRDLPVGTEITNTAAIYFDFNAPVITNRVQNTVFGEDIALAVTIVACDEYEYNGQLYTQSTSVVDTFDLIFYDSIVIADIFIFHSDEVFLSEEYCEGENPVEPGTYTTVYTNQYDCDSTVHLEVIVHPTYELTEEVSLQPGDTYEGMAYFSDTTFVKDLQTVEDCDSTITVIIDVMTTNLATSPAQLFNAQITPNPSPGLFNVHLRSPTTAPLRWRLYSTIGKELATGHWLVAGESHEQLDMRSRPAGVYLLQMEIRGQLFTYRLIKF